MVKITLARSHEAVRRAWAEHGEVIPATCEVEVKTSALSPATRARYTGDSINIVAELLDSQIVRIL